MDQNELPLEPRHLEVPSGASKMISQRMACLAQTVNLSCPTVTLSPNISNWDSTDPCHSLWYIRRKPCTYLASPNGVILTVSKWTEMRFHVCHVTKLFHRVHPKRLLSLWYVRHKPCTYLASRLAVSPNRLKWVSTWASWRRSTIGCV
jgi:hypothetical protein